jgi:hypothetical protein
MFFGEQMAILISTDGTQEIVKPVGEKFTVAEICKLLGCDSVETVTLPGGFTLSVDAAGKRKTGILNELATAFKNTVVGHPGDFVIGDALVCEPGEA